jgi:peroxiredoxin
VVAFVRGIGGVQARGAIRVLQRVLPAVQRLGGNIVAVTPGPLDVVRDFVPRWHVRLPVVVDAGSEIRRAWGVPTADSPVWPDLSPLAVRLAVTTLFEGHVHRAHVDLLPAVFVLDGAGVVRDADLATTRWTLPDGGRVLRSVERAAGCSAG